jgi:hypothetical protein
MIKHLKVKNVHGVSYEMHFLSDKEKNTVSVNGLTYFNTYFISTNGETSYKLAILPLLIVKTESSQLLIDSASSLSEGEEAVIEIDLEYTNGNGKYQAFSYKLVYTNDGILDELVNGKTIRSSHTDDWDRDLDSTLFRFLNTQLLVLDFSLSGNVNRCIDIGEQLVESPGYNKFVTFLFRDLGYDLDRIKVEKKSDYTQEVIFVYNTEGGGDFEVPLRTEDPGTQHIFVVASFMLSAFCSGSTLFLSTLDNYIGSSDLKVIISYFQNNTDISGEPRIPCQLVAALTNVDIVGRENMATRGRNLPDPNDFKIYREQVMVVQESKGLTYYHWHKNIF